MPTSPKRDNAYWKGRLMKDGHHEILARYERDEITMYAATHEAGYRSKQPKSPAGKLQFHWKRASHEERKRFVRAHPMEVHRVLSEVKDDVTAENTSQ